MSATLAQAQAEFAAAGQTKGQKYVQNASGAGQKWESNGSSAAAENNYGAGVQRAVASKKRAAGITRVGAGAYTSGVTSKGGLNYGTGMVAGAPKWAQRVSPFVPLWSQELTTARGMKRSPQNLQRMSENVDRFEKAAGA